MKKLTGLILVLFVSLAFAAPVLADQAADDQAAMDQIMAKVDSGEMTIEQALTEAIGQGISFSAIVSACQTRGIALSNIITAAAAAGMSSEVALAKMADAGVSKADMSAAMSQAAGQTGADQADTGLAYTPAETSGTITPVQPVTSNPGGTAQTGTVSPSSL